MLKNSRWQWMALAAIVVAAFLLRAYDVSRVFLWFDETDMFNEYVYGAHPKSLVDFALTTRNNTTVTWGWPAVIWIVSRLFGPTIGVARMATVLVSTAGVLLVFLLVYRLLPRDSGGSRFWPAIFAAALAAVSILQIEYSQRTYPYGIAPCLAAAILLAHFEILRATEGGWKRTPELIRAVVLYTAAVSIALCVHGSLALLPAVSLGFLAIGAIRNLSGQPAAERNRILQLALAAGAVMFCAALANAKNPKYGYRGYLAEFYTPPSLSAIPKLLRHAYDLGAYQLNLFYNPALYWPESLNPILLPLILLCILGWAMAVYGKFGRQMRHLALVAVAATIAPAVLSMVKVFPFGAVRQVLFLSPFFVAFTALGFYALRAYPLARVAGIAVASGYLALWAVNLPRFYAEREPVYTADELVNAWKQTGSLPVYARECERELRYELRQHPEIHIDTLPAVSRAPYLLIETHNWIDDHRWFADYPDFLRKAGYTATTIKWVPAKHYSRSQSLYFPPNGLWIYKVTAN